MNKHALAKAADHYAIPILALIVGACLFLAIQSVSAMGARVPHPFSEDGKPMVNSAEFEDVSWAHVNELLDERREIERMYEDNSTALQRAENKIKMGLAELEAEKARIAGWFDAIPRIMMSAVTGQWESALTQASNQARNDAIGGAVSGSAAGLGIGGLINLVRTRRKIGKLQVENEKLKATGKTSTG